MEQSYVTLVTNDEYGIGALVLVASLRQTDTQKKLTVMIGEHVSDELRNILTTSFDNAIGIEEIRNQDSTSAFLFGRPELAVTYSKIHAWSLIQFSKVVFLDADTVVLHNIDELFELEELSAVPDPSWPDCFNTGVMVLEPNMKTFNELRKISSESGASFDGGDQGLLNKYYENWLTKGISHRLSYVFNCICRITDQAGMDFYTSAPAWVKFGSTIRVAHFCGPIKPWHRVSAARGCSKAAYVALLGTSPERRCISRTDGMLAYWWSIFLILVRPQLSADLYLGDFYLEAQESYSPAPVTPENSTHHEPYQTSFSQPYPPETIIRESHHDDHSEFKPYHPEFHEVRWDYLHYGQRTDQANRFPDNHKVPQQEVPPPLAFSHTYTAPKEEPSTAPASQDYERITHGAHLELRREDVHSHVQTRDSHRDQSPPPPPPSPPPPSPPPSPPPPQMEGESSRDDHSRHPTEPVSSQPVHPESNRDSNFNRPATSVWFPSPPPPPPPVQPPQSSSSYSLECQKCRKEICGKDHGTEDQTNNKTNASETKRSDVLKLVIPKNRKAAKMSAQKPNLPKSSEWKTQTVLTERGKVNRKIQSISNRQHRSGLPLTMSGQLLLSSGAPRLERRLKLDEPSITPLKLSPLRKEDKKTRDKLNIRALDLAIINKQPKRSSTTKNKSEIDQGKEVILNKWKLWREEMQHIQKRVKSFDIPQIERSPMISNSLKSTISLKSECEEILLPSNEEIPSQSMEKASVEPKKMIRDPVLSNPFLVDPIMCGAVFEKSKRQSTSRRRKPDPRLRTRRVVAKEADVNRESKELREMQKAWTRQKVPGIAGQLGALKIDNKMCAHHEWVDTERMYAWERGHIDYMGADRFDNILAKLSETISRASGDENLPFGLDMHHLTGT